MTQDGSYELSGKAAIPRAVPAVESAALAGMEQLTSLDAYHGAIMLLMASSGLGLAEVARQFPSPIKVKEV